MYRFFKAPPSHSQTLSTMSAIVLGAIPAILIIIIFEFIYPSEILGNELLLPSLPGAIDTKKYALYIAFGGIHIIICLISILISFRSLLPRVRFGTGQHIFYCVFISYIVIILIFLWACHTETKLYKISYDRIINVLAQSGHFDYQFKACSNQYVRFIFCASGNFHLSIFAFILISLGMISTISACSDIGIMKYHHSKPMTPKKIAVNSNEISYDINRCAINLLSVLTTSSLCISIFQQIGYSMFKENSKEYLLYRSAGEVASLFWPIVFSSIFIGIFIIPAGIILEKRGEALRLLNSDHISSPEFESFFAIKQGIPQSLKWIVMSGLPMIASLASGLIGIRL